MVVNEIIRKRKSIRRYEQGAAVTDEQIRTILEAAMLAPSACNSRPWEFMVVKNREKLNQVIEIHPHAKMLKTASLAIAVNADLNSQHRYSKRIFPTRLCSSSTKHIITKCRIRFRNMLVWSISKRRINRTY